ncbi:hypothetical protein ABZT07_20520 [Streptomyces sp. NPDC005317]|uniref:hypothetical protein n=1 Tax=Streptomyces sp. NPDC005317 TaxID=3156876 RepID=UPI00339E8FD5
MTDAYDRFQTIEIHTPDDVPPATPLVWQIERISVHEQPGLRGTAADALTVLALRENVRRELERTGRYISDARRVGATWEQIAAALDISTNDARERLRTWADGQQRLYQQDVADGRERPVGISSDQYAALLADLTTP